MLVLLVS